jgi:hypothetical protein
MDEDNFETAERSSGDLAGVFEYDGETGYFYLYNLEAQDGERVVDSIHIFSGKPDFKGADFKVAWDDNEQLVGLFIRDVLWAVFDMSRRKKYGGNYKRGGKPLLPPEAVFEA